MKNKAEFSFIVLRRKFVVRNPPFVLRNPSLHLTLSSSEAAYRRAKFASAGEMRFPILRYDACAPTQDEGSRALARDESVKRSAKPDAAQWDNPEEGLSLRKRLLVSPIGKMRIRADAFLMYISIILSSLLPVRFRFFEMVV